MQRLRLKFGRGEGLKFLSHLDLMRLWERALRRAELPLAYSEGFTPHPRISMAVPLSVGVTSQAELMDIFLSRWMSPDSFNTHFREQLPDDIDLLESQSIGLDIPSLQSQVRFVEYRVEVETDKGQTEAQAALQSLLLASTLPWHHLRSKEVRHYDLRMLVDDLWVIDCCDATCVLGMKLCCDARGTGRPEQVTKALGFPQRPRSIHRTRVILN